MEYFEEFNPAAALVTAVMGALVFYGMFLVDGVEVIDMTTRVISFVVAIPMGYAFAVHLIEK